MPQRAEPTHNVNIRVWSRRTLDQLVRRGKKREEMELNQMFSEGSHQRLLTSSQSSGDHEHVVPLARQTFTIPPDEGYEEV